MDSREMRPCWLLESINLFIRKMHRHQHPMHMKILRTMKQLLDILLDSLRLNMTKHKHACFQQTDINNIITSQLQPLFLMEKSWYHQSMQKRKNPPINSWNLIGHSGIAGFQWRQRRTEYVENGHRDSLDGTDFKRGAQIACVWKSRFSMFFTPGMRLWYMEIWWVFACLVVDTNIWPFFGM